MKHPRLISSGLVLLILTLGTFAAYQLTHTNQDIRQGATGPLTNAKVASGDLINGSLTPSGSYLTSIITTQDLGYFLKFSDSSGNPIAFAIMEVSLQDTNGNWSGWSTFALNGTALTTDTSGVIPVDFSLWPPTPLNTYTAKFRVKNTASESNPISVKVDPIDMSHYLKFYPGNYWDMLGCPGKTDYSQCTKANQYQFRMDVENTHSISITKSGTTHSINANPVRATNSPNAPTSQAGGNQDYTWYAATGYDPFGNISAKWALKTVFFNRYTNHTFTKQQKHTAVFLRNAPTWPSYFIAHPSHDLTLVYDTYAMDTAVVSNTSFIQGDITNLITQIHEDVGWKTTYKMAKVNLPKYSGTVLRIRFWEYDPEEGSLTNAKFINFDEWLFAKDRGLIGINNKVFNNVACNTDPDCMDQTTIMQTPTFAVSVFEQAVYANNAKVDLKFGKNGSFGNSVTIAPGEPYQIKVTNPDGQLYSGFIEVQGTINLESGGTITIPRSIFKNTDDNELWLQTGQSTVNTLTSTAKGTYAVTVRPHIYMFDGSLGPNRHAWSNSATVVITSPTPNPSKTPTPLPPTPTKTPTPSKTPTPTKSPTPTKTPTPVPPTPTKTPTPTSIPPTPTKTPTPKPSSTTSPATPTPTPIPGDADGNHIVNILDYSLLISQFGNSCTPQNPCSANFDGNSTVDILDYSILIAHFGTGS